MNKLNMWRVNLVEFAKIVCPFQGCDKSFRKPSQLEQHQRMHTGERPYMCLVDSCEKRYARAAHLKRHYEQSHSVNDAYDRAEYYICGEDGCYQKFTKKQNLTKHVLNVHERAGIYLCSVEGCKERFSRPFELRHHLFQHKGVLPYQCHYGDCMKQFKQTSHLRRHLRSHAGYVCEVDGCCQKFESWSLLRKHKAVDHKKVLQCDFCQKIFLRPCLLRSHITLAHPADNAVEVYQCTESGCNRTYASVRNMKRHIQLFHEGQVVECPQCFRSLSTKQKLQQHMKLHGPTEAGQRKKLRLNMHRRKPFRKLVAEMVTAEDCSTEVVTDAPTCDVDDVGSCKVDQETTA